MLVDDLKWKVLSGEYISKDEALFLAKADLTKLSDAADEIRNFYFERDFDICSVVSCKAGRCTENCKYCAQSSCSAENVKTRALISSDELLKDAKLRNSQNIRHYGLVASGRKLSDGEIDKICVSIKDVCRNTNIKVCASMGLLGEEQFKKLKAAGVVRIHNNLETSRRYFPMVCTSHTYDEKLNTIKAAKKAGLEICSGGIIGIGENMEDRIDMAITLRELGVHSVPVNMLKPIPGTPFGSMTVLEGEEVQRVIALFRFLLPKSYIRLAAGRDYLADSGLSCFMSGSNAAITGDMLTVKGITVEKDLKSIHGLGYEF